MMIDHVHTCSMQMVLKKHLNASAYKLLENAKPLFGKPSRKKRGLAIFLFLVRDHYLQRR